MDAALIRLLIAGLTTAIATSLAGAQTPLGSAFTYQGELRQGGNPASGAADLRFRLYTADIAGSQVGGEVAINNAALMAGRFTATVDFGATAFGSDARWVEVDARHPAGSGSFITLSPRLRVTPAPAARYAAESGTAANATQFNGQSASFYQNAANLSGTIPPGLLSGSYSGAVSFGNSGNSFAGSGSGLIGLSASNVSAGTLADGRLSSNVALLSGSQTFTGAKSFNGGLTTNSFGMTPGASAGRVLTSDAFGVGTWQSPVVPSPLDLQASTNNWVFGAQNSSQLDNAIGVLGVMTSTAAGSSSAAVRGQNKSTSGSGIGVWGSQDGSGWGVYGSSASGMAVRGLVTDTSGDNVGVWGQSPSNTGRGVVGYVTSTTAGTSYGVIGQTDGQGGYGVYGLANSSFFLGQRYGVYGYHVGGTVSTAYGVFANGGLGASGTKSFRIDHPTDPLNKYLLHYSSESPEPQNFYSGVVITDAAGYAWVELPEYFESINKDFKYQLTAVNEADDVFVQVMVTKKIVANRFQVRASKGGAEVSWRIEATRNDAYCRRHPSPTVVDKIDDEKGKYQRPELYDAPASMGVATPIRGQAKAGQE